MSHGYNGSKKNFSYWNYDKGVLLDEKKKRFMDFEDMDPMTYRNYSIAFNTYRPDYFGVRSIINDGKTHTLAITFLNRMYYQRIQEMGRMWLLFRNISGNYVMPLYEHHIKLGNSDKYHMSMMYKWDDSSIAIGYLDYVTRRITKYGLHRGPLCSIKFPGYKDEIQNEEDQLAEYFLYEMRKAPAEEKILPRMPIA